MKCLIFASIGLIAIACTPTRDDSELDILGGRFATVVQDGVESKTFTSTVELTFQDYSTCTATRVGPRHFLTAAHCLDGVDADSKLVIKSHKTDQSISMKISSSSLVSEIKLREVNHDHSRKLERDGNSDWAIIVTGGEDEIYSSIALTKTLDENFDTRKLGNPNALAVGDVVLAAGWGIHDLETTSLATCYEGSECTIRESEDFVETPGARYSRALRRAFFKITDIARTKNPESPSYFEAIAHIAQAVTEANLDMGIFGRIEYVPGMQNDDDSGLLMLGDSGGPVILEKNGEQLIVGVIKGQVGYPWEPVEIREIFSTFDLKLVEETMQIPIIDATSKYTRAGRSIIVTGYRTEMIEIRAAQSNINLDKDPNCSNLNLEDRTELDVASGFDRSPYSCWHVPSNLDPQFLELYVMGKPSGRSIEVVADGKCSLARIEYNRRQYTQDIEKPFIGEQVWEFYSPNTGPIKSGKYDFTPVSKWPEEFDKVTLEVQERGGYSCLRWTEDGTCVPPPKTFSFTISTPSETLSVQTPSIESSKVQKFDITRNFSDWLKSDTLTLLDQSYLINVQSLDETVGVGIRINLVFHKCDINDQP
ncbi:MAG: trypsin-like serine protease [Proteobacteria bacterium]|nr:MAG: trypsin-like serine protease [Pseudomonadota bacterium]